MRNMIRHGWNVAQHLSAFGDAQAHVDEGGRDVADGRQRLQPAQSVRPSPVRHDFGHQRHADGKLAADAQAGQEAIQRKIPDARPTARSGP